MNPSEIKAVLAEIGGAPNKKLGQHFLIDKKTLEGIVETAQIKPGDCVLEIGPGLGVLTQALLQAGADVKAIEQDRRFAEYLKKKFAGTETPLTPLIRGEYESDLPLIRGNEGVSVTHADATSFDWSSLIGGQRWKFISNLPYAISSFALREALWRKDPPEKIVVLVQREVAERAIAKDSKTSLLSLMVALASSSAQMVRRVPPGAFYPPPKVESAILEIIPSSIDERKKRWGLDPENIMALAKKGFAHPRKFLFSNLALSVVDLPLTDLKINPKARAEDLSPDDWAGLARYLANV